MNPLRAMPSVPGTVTATGDRDETAYFRRLLNARSPAHGRSNAPEGATRSGVEARVANTPTLLKEAAALVRQRYAWRGYLTTGMGDACRDETRDEIALVAVVRGRVTGTITLGLDGPAGLWIDRTYPAEAARHRARGATLCEITRLAIAPRSDTRTILAALFELAHAKGRRDRRATDLFVEVNPRHASFYRRVFGFEIVSGVRECGRVKAPAVLLHLDIANVDESLVRFLAQRAAALPDIDADPVPASDVAALNR